MIFDNINGRNMKMNNFIFGLKRAVVKDLKDSDSLNKVTLNLIDEDLEIKNVPVMASFAGKDYGSVCIPSVGDEVLVGFLGGEISRPVILGSLYNESNKPPIVINDKNEIIMGLLPGKFKVEYNRNSDKPKITITTKKEHKINIDDDAEFVSIESKDGKTSFKVDFKNGSIDLTAEKKISFSAGKDTMILEDSKGLTIKSSSGALQVDVNKFQIKSKSNADITANAQVKVKGNSGANIESSGQTVVKGTMVKIN